MKFAPHIGDPHGGPQTSPQHADPHRLGAFVKKNHIQEIHVDRRVVGLVSRGRHVDHPCGGLISPWPAREVTEYTNLKEHTHIHTYIYIYKYAVELLSGPHLGVFNSY